jgi:hypothetical protein
LEEVYYEGSWVEVDPQPTVALTAEVSVNLIQREAVAPEPATLGLVGGGLMLLGLMRRRTPGTRTTSKQ